MGICPMFCVCFVKTVLRGSSMCSPHLSHATEKDQFSLYKGQPQIYKLPTSASLGSDARLNTLGFNDPDLCVHVCTCSWTWGLLCRSGNNSDELVLLPPCRPLELNSGYQAWQHVPSIRANSLACLSQINGLHLQTD